MKAKTILPILLALAVVGIFWWCFIVLIFNYEFVKYNNIDNYNHYLNKLHNNSDVHSDLEIFPKQINGNVLDFKYYRQDGLFDGSYLFYLIVNYDEEQYISEENRIHNISINSNGKYKSPIYEPDKFKYPAYITIYDGFGTYEYALLDEKTHSIIYVFNQLIPWDDTGG